MLVPKAEPVSGRKLAVRSEEHTSELQSRLHLVCRLLLEKKKIHDGLGQAFTGILLQLGALELRLAESAPQEGALLENVRHLARDRLTEARRSAHAPRLQA